MSMWEESCWNCQAPRDSESFLSLEPLEPREPREPLGKVPSVSHHEPPHATSISDLDERLSETEIYSAKPRLKRHRAASDLDNERRAGTEASDAKPRMLPATAASVLNNERPDSIRNSKAKQEVIYTMKELICICNHVLESKDLTWDDEIVKDALSVLSSSLNALADKIGASGSQLGLRAMAFIQEYRL